MRAARQATASGAVTVTRITMTKGVLPLAIILIYHIFLVGICAAYTTLQSCQQMSSMNISSVLAIGAHPDDLETACGGALAFFVSCNIQVNYLLTTNGDKGWSKNYNMTSYELAPIRQSEQLNAAAVMGARNVTFLKQEDGRLEGVDPISLKKNITIAIREYKPDLILTFSPETDYNAFPYGLMHADHQTTGRSVLNCAWPSIRDYLSFIDLYDEGILPWIVPHVWFFSFSRQLNQNDYLLNIEGAYFQKKYEALLQHKSQYDNATGVKNDLISQAQFVSVSNGLPSSYLTEAYQVITFGPLATPSAPSPSPSPALSPSPSNHPLSLSVIVGIVFSSLVAGAVVAYIGLRYYEHKLASTRTDPGEMSSYPYVKM
jgi:LmbE family N-acetylglucosaminyl deacetylase